MRREFVWNLNLKNESEWRKYLKTENRPWNITTNPSKIYKDKGWISMSDWLGTKKGWDGKHLDFEVAREIVREENLQSQNEWYDYIKNKKPIIFRQTLNLFIKKNGNHFLIGLELMKDGKVMSGKVMRKQKSLCML